MFLKARKIWVILTSRKQSHPKMPWFFINFRIPWFFHAWNFFQPSSMFSRACGNSVKWASSWQNQQDDLCAQRWLGSAWASAQSDPSLQCAHWVAEDPMFLYADSADRQGGCPGWSESLLGAKVIWLDLSWGGSNDSIWPKYCWLGG